MLPIRKRKLEDVLRWFLVGHHDSSAPVCSPSLSVAYFHCNYTTISQFYSFYSLLPVVAMLAWLCLATEPNLDQVRFCFKPHCKLLVLIDIL